ncbi:MAG: LysM peptidoglycan-binding domain-containing protein [Actinomycetota bacterium]
MTTSPTHAYLELVERSGSGPGATTQSGGGTQIRFQFNPKEFQVAKKANWKSSPTKGNKNAPPPEYTGPDAASMTLEMFLDASDQSAGDVSKDVQKLFDACAPTASSDSKNKPLPPLVRFGWDKVYFNGYMESVNAKYTLFRQDGKPIRALCSITLKEFPKDQAKQNPTSGSERAQRSVQVVAGDTLAGIAWREYGDPTRWRVIAEANGIDDPLRLLPATRLLVPSADDLVN